MDSSTGAGREGIVVETQSDGQRVLWTLVPELPDEAQRLASPWLTVIGWAYDGSSRHGMPDDETNGQMLQLENALGLIERPGFCHEAYRRIGEGLREFVFHVADRDQFLRALNERLETHPRYPIEIKFFSDPAWSDLRQLIEDLGLH